MRFSMTDELSAKMDILIRLQAAALVSDFDTQKEKIAFLSGAGLEAKEIATILGTSRNTVSVALSSLKKDGKKDGTKK